MCPLFLRESANGVHSISSNTQTFSWKTMKHCYFSIQFKDKRLYPGEGARVPLVPFVLLKLFTKFVPQRNIWPHFLPGGGGGGYFNTPDTLFTNI